jgi:CHAT domain-containing protein
MDDGVGPILRPPLTKLSSTLIVGDPTEDLPVALQEARAVASRALAPSQTVLIHAEATKQALLVGWPNVDLFHFSGHARFGGLDGVESSLSLAANAQLNLADVLTAAGSPRFAVLSACDAGRARTASEGGLGMSHALIAAGSEVVVAPSRVVADTRAAAFADELYSALRGYSLDDWATSTRQATLALRSSNPDVDWSAYRVHAAH